MPMKPPLHRPYTTKPRPVDNRPSAAARGYGHAWRTIREAHLKRKPWCKCGKKAQHVDHITPRAAGGSDEASNLQSMCASCHSRKTAAKDGAFGNKVAKSGQKQGFIRFGSR